MDLKHIWFPIISLLIGIIGLISIILLAIFHQRNAKIAHIAGRTSLTCIGILFIIVMMKSLIR
jgi:uncharacterized alpha/beta hydrolase family protein